VFYYIGKGKTLFILLHFTAIGGPMGSVCPLTRFSGIGYESEAARG
jgi:hypothetical protein